MDHSDNPINNTQNQKTISPKVYPLIPSENEANSKDQTAFETTRTSSHFPESTTIPRLSMFATLPRANRVLPLQDADPPSLASSPRSSAALPNIGSDQRNPPPTNTDPDRKRRFSNTENVLVRSSAWSLDARKAGDTSEPHHKTKVETILPGGNQWEKCSEEPGQSGSKSPKQKIDVTNSNQSKEPDDNNIASQESLLSVFSHDAGARTFLFHENRKLIQSELAGSSWRSRIDIGSNDNESGSRSLSLRDPITMVCLGDQRLEDHRQNSRPARPALDAVLAIHMTVDVPQHELIRQQAHLSPASFSNTLSVTPDPMKRRSALSLAMPVAESVKSDSSDEPQPTVGDKQNLSTTRGASQNHRKSVSAQRVITFNREGLFDLTEQSLQMTTLTFRPAQLEKAYQVECIYQNAIITARFFAWFGLLNVVARGLIVYLSTGPFWDASDGPVYQENSLMRIGIRQIPNH
ncbi:hypothetical protein BJ742DRAFT_891819 [Cladochytrium replicatum]|nr:hypothetical protein BJ742DRAFT_891819 [Cladochytrium replicatum]